MKTLTILSGGIDSTTLLYKTIEEADEVIAVIFNYGQKHSKEISYAVNTCERLGIKYGIINIQNVGKVLDSSLTQNEEVPEGYYSDENMQSTVVPNRNTIMLSIAYGIAVLKDADKLYYGAHTGDHAIYPDCRLEFVEQLEKAFQLGTDTKIGLKAPFIDYTKADIVKEGLKLDVPYEDTWSCYKGGERPCLKCGTCTERTEAFLENGVKDSALTEDEWEKAVIYLGEVR